MKRLTMIITLLAVLAIAGTAQAATTYTLLDGVAVTGGGTPQASTYGYPRWGCKLKFTGSPTSLEVCLQGDPSGGTDFEDMLCITPTAGQLAAGYAARGVVDNISTNIRGNVKSLVGGTAPRVYFYCTGAN